MLSYVNVGTGKYVAIQEMAETIKQVVGYMGKLTYAGSLESLASIDNDARYILSKWIFAMLVS